MGSRMLAIAICEDEEHLLDELHRKVEKYTEQNQVSANIKTYLCGEDLLKEEISFDVILLDLKLPGINGMEVARQLPPGSRIIFITSYQEYAVEAFEVEAVHYLLKPVTEERLCLALDRAVRRTEQMDDQALTLMKSGETCVIRIRDILYCEVFNHQVSVYTRHGGFTCSGTLDDLENRLDERFFRCHRSFIVNLNAVAGQEKGTAILTNGEKILISRRKQSEFMQKLLMFMKNEVI